MMIFKFQNAPQAKILIFEDEISDFTDEILNFTDEILAFTDEISNSTDEVLDWSAPQAKILNFGLFWWWNF